MNASHDLWSTAIEYGELVVGAVLQAIALQLFLVPAHLVSGGVSGVAQLINYYTGWPIGAMVLIGNIPLFLVGWRYLGGRRFALRTGLAILIFSLATDLIPRLGIFPPDGITDDIFLNSLYGAVVSGVGYGLVYRAGATSGGSDILARILNHYRSIPMTQSYLLVDSAVILAAGFVFGWKQALYAIITLYVSGLVSDAVLQGPTTVRTAMIVTGQASLISDRILEEMERGVTILHGTGGYTGNDRPVVYCVVTRSEVAQLKAIVHEADPQAFIVIGQAHEAFGEGFKPLQKA
ncbi:MAG TPA: YitT family protein [Anaerolineales bacterium]|nr:YitT family protein [Anaerolineales bacterium]